MYALADGWDFLDWFLNPTDENTAQVWGWIGEFASYFANFMNSIPRFYVPIFVLFTGVAVTYMIIGRQS